MNDPGLEDQIQDTATNVTHTLRARIPSSDEKTSTLHKSEARAGESKQESAGDAFRRELQEDEDEEEVGYFAPKRWWFTSTAFPLLAGTFGPIANLFSVCALAQTWRVKISDGETETQGQRIPDPHWLLGLNSASLVLALAANVLLLFNFARRVRYIIAQPVTISLWYLASILLIVPLCLTPSISPPSDASLGSQHALSQSYYYALISAILYIVLSTLLLLHLIFSLPPFRAYPASFVTLTIPQRTLMLQTISLSLYLALGAGVFAALEGWEFCDGVYWADYTLLTIGLGSDFPLQTSAARGVLIPYTGGGIVLVGLVVGSVRGLVLERGGVKMMRRSMAKARDRGVDHVQRNSTTGGDAMKAEFEAMRKVAERAELSRKYTALSISFFVFLTVWFLGAMVFFFSEKPQNWSYGTSLYFTYTTLLTIGYGDLFPESNSGKPFFVIWTLIAIPTVTILISNMGDTVVAWVKKGTIWLGQRTVLPERSIKRDKDDKTNTYRRRKGFWPLKSPESVEKAVDAEQAREVEEGAVPDPDSKHAAGKGVRSEMGKMGSAVEKEEQERGKGGGLAAKLAREIRMVSKDLGKKPERKYEWEEWKRWMDLLDGPDGLDGLKSRTAPLKKGKTNSDTTADGNGGEDGERQWIWLGDEGPLFSSESEADWILGKLCERLEQVLEKELNDAKRSGDTR